MCGSRQSESGDDDSSNHELLARIRYPTGPAADGSLVVGDGDIGGQLQVNPELVRKGVLRRWRRGGVTAGSRGRAVRAGVCDACNSKAARCGHCTATASRGAAAVLGPDHCQ